MIGSWFPGVENECKMNSSPHAAYRWEIQFSSIYLLTILMNKQWWKKNSERNS
jgi:hypothetical protein